MTIRAPNLNHLWTTLLIEELVRNGVDTFCVAPGSRSAPLSVAVARHDRTRCIVHHDERGAAFHALGYARATRVPAAVVTTSGSALANVWPAVVEASLAQVPLLVLSADRPPELQDAGANQTMDQVRFFGEFVRWSTNLPCPSTRIDPAVVLTAADQATSRCRGPTAGAVHVNCMFREPLAPSDRGECYDAYLEPVRAWYESDRVYTRYEDPSILPAHESLAEVAELVRRCPRGLLVAGRLSGPEARGAVIELAESLRWPLLPDVTSGLRLDARPRTIVPYHDVLLSSAVFVRRHRIQTVLHLGGRLTSKWLLERLDAVRPEEYVVVDDHPNRQDPIHRVTKRFTLPVAAFCKTLGDLVADAGDTGEAHWTESWREASERVGRALSAQFARDADLNEPKVAWLVSRCIGAGEGLYLASSMPVRDMDIFGCPKPEPVQVGANRGASGIDGTIAAAAGFARGLGSSVTLITGDVAFLHDLNSLGLVHTLEAPMVIVLLNNDGGGIFSFLPIAEHADVFERCFGTPHGMTFEHAASLFGLDYARPTSGDEFVRAYEGARRRTGATLIEVQTRRRENYDLHASLRDAALKCIEPAFLTGSRLRTRM